MWFILFLGALYQFQQLHTEINDALSELKNCDERCKKAMMDAARMAEELHAEQEHSQNLDRQRKGYEQQIKVNFNKNYEVNCIEINKDHVVET